MYRKHFPRLFRAGYKNSEVFNSALFFEFFTERFRHEIGRLQVDVQVKVSHALCGRRPDRGDLRCTNFAAVLVKLKEDLEKRIDPVRTGENDPVVGMRVLDEFRELTE